MNTSSVYPVKLSRGLVHVIILLCLTIAVFGAWYVSKKTPESLPGDNLYFLKSLAESFQVSSAINNDEKAKVDFNIHTIKLGEFERVLGESGNSEKLKQTLLKINENRVKVLENVETLNTRRESVEEISANFIKNLDREQEIFSGSLKKIPLDLREAVEKELEESRKVKLRIIEIEKNNKKENFNQGSRSLPGGVTNSPVSPYPTGYTVPENPGGVVSTPTRYPSTETPTPVPDNGNGNPKPTRIPLSG